jgi:hypothetical protein
MNAEIPREEKRTVGGGADSERSPSGLSTRAKGSNRSTVGETALFVRIVAERFVLGLPTTAKGKSRVLGLLLPGLERKITSNVQGPAILN